MSGNTLRTFPAKRIIILRALYLGDLLCATPAFRALRSRFPDAEVTLIGLPWARDFVERLPSLDRLVLSPGFATLPEVPFEPERTAAFFAACRAEGYDLAIQLQGSGRTTNELAAALGARCSIGFGTADDPWMTATEPWIEEENEILRCLRLMTLVGADVSDPALELPISEEELARGGLLLAGLESTGTPIVAMHAGAKDPRRRWPVERFAQVGDELIRRFGARIVLTGGPEDRSLAEEIQASMRGSSLDLTGKTDLGTFAAVLRRVDLLVSNDTGASHLAVATRTPSVVLFGFARPERWAPLDRSLHTVIDAVTFDGRQADPATALLDLPLEPVLERCIQKLAAKWPLPADGPPPAPVLASSGGCIR
jgi:ADP-heptose:LPS heptosyltransferase